MMVKKEMIAMLLAGGQGSRLGILTSDVAKPAVSFGGKYRIIDFPLSNCINSGIDTVGVLTQYMPLRLNAHVGIGIPWDLDKNLGGVSVLSPYEKIQNTEWYTGTANAIYQNIAYMESFNPEYVLILSGDHIYKMDYEAMLESHKENGAEVSIAVMPVSLEEASRFGIMITDENGRITELIDIVPEFNLYEEYWKIYTKSTSITPQYFGPNSVIERTITGEGTEIYGKVYSSVIGCDVTIGEGSIVRNSIIMNGTVIGDGCILDKVICAENSVIGSGAVLGEGEEAPNDTRPDIYCAGLVTVGENTVIPAGVRIGKNVMISGHTTESDYPGGRLASGKTLQVAAQML